MEISDEKINKLVDFIYRRLRDKRWLYWPPGPMLGQVFDSDQAKKDISDFLRKDD